MSYTKEDFYVGQRVRIRDVGDMAAEYGTRPLSNEIGYAIKCPGLIFNKDRMSIFCGLTAEIITISENGVYVELDHLEDSYGNPVKDINPAYWGWSIYMVEPIDEKETKSGFDSALFDQMIGVIT